MREIDSRTRWASRLRQGPPVLADGAMGTELQQRGLPWGTPSDGFTLSRPDAVLEVHRAYRAAGAEMLLTNTFNAWGCLEAAAGPHPPPLITRAVGLARQAGGETTFVAGSIGPSIGLEEARARDGAATLARWFQEAGADLIWLESQLSLERVCRIVPALQAACDLPLLVSFSFHGRGHTTQQGESPAVVAGALASMGVAAAGANCGDHPAHLAGVLEAMHRAAPTLPLIAKPSAGMPERIEGGMRYPVDPEAFASFAPAWIEAGARIVGGCCGAGPEHVLALARAIPSREPV